MVKIDKIDNLNVGCRKKIKKNKILKPSLVAISVTMGLQTSTQFFAHKLNYHPALGDNFNHIYYPWSIVEWGYKWSAQYQDFFYHAAAPGLVISSLGILGISIISVISANSSKANKNLHGSARWAAKKDIQAAGLIPKDRLLDKLLKKNKSDGVYVGAWVDDHGTFHYLRHNGPEHILTYAPTRSGKGVGLVIPTLLSWAESTVITDLKGELWALTAGWRKKYANNKVIKFEPASAIGSACWNPLDEIRLDTEYEVGDAQNLATLIVDPDGKGLRDHWQKTSQSLLVGLIIHLLYKSKNECTLASLSTLDKILANPEQSNSELWQEMLTYQHFPDGHEQVHPVVAATARDMIDRPEEEMGSVLSTAKSYLALYRDPIVAKNTNSSNFKVKDLMNYDTPVSLYIITQPTDKLRLCPLVRILMNMIIRINAGKMEFVKGRAKKLYKHRLLGVIDEFPSLGKLEILQESLAFLAGYGIKFYLICQDINQLKSEKTGYGKDETITSNCHIQNAFPPNRIETAEHLSKTTGITTVVKEDITTSGKRVGIFHSNVSRHIQEVQRPLLTADECMRMQGPIKNSAGDIIEPGDMIIYVAGYPAIYGVQPLFFKDPVFLARSQVGAPAESDILRKETTDEIRIQ
ncbi:conjugal transfer protein TraG [Gilliamella sp. HK2]|jgi:type IV secretion system protein VirD4|uniref:type IV secretory system conjugative DNA transfer family protein n=1 Tax=unclassified Gilliamella TaxID=2685620 RepID=UPI00080EE386|nr:type IV secretory system conjugative DNA transfer family protein [Gilliamella apicola]OCG28965.1 conjugal transfer protein TraG [Gilliamella apicola]OCG31437.1 conjugal transfer protein TraG [Gilliamella apicola]